MSPNTSSRGPSKGRRPASSSYRITPRPEMVDARGGAGLAVEALDQLGTDLGAEAGHLEGDLAPEHGVLGQVDGTHAALPELPEDAVAAELLRQRGGSHGARSPGRLHLRQHP